MAWFIDDISVFVAPTLFTTADIFAILVISTFLCIIAAVTYKYTHTGISYSPSFVQTTVILGVIVSMIMLIIGMSKMKFGAEKQSDEMLKIIIPGTLDYEKAFQEVFKQHLSHFNLLNLEHLGTDKEALIEMTYLIRFKKTPASKTVFINELKKINPNNKISVFGTERLVY